MNQLVDLGLRLRRQHLLTSQIPLPSHNRKTASPMTTTSETVRKLLLAHFESDSLAHKPPTRWGGESVVLITRLSAPPRVITSPKNAARAPITSTCD